MMMEFVQKMNCSIGQDTAGFGVPPIWLVSFLKSGYCKDVVLQWLSVLQYPEELLPQSNFVTRLDREDHSSSKGSKEILMKIY